MSASTEKQGQVLSQAKAISFLCGKISEICTGTAELAVRVSREGEGSDIALLANGLASHHKLNTLAELYNDMGSCTEEDKRRVDSVLEKARELFPLGGDS